jgi:hypothetical protein
MGLQTTARGPDAAREVILSGPRRSFCPLNKCLLEVAEELCTENSKLFENVALCANTITRRVADIGENIVTLIAKNSRKFSHFSIAMDESLGSCSTSQHFRVD